MYFMSLISWGLDWIGRIYIYESFPLLLHGNATCTYNGTHHHCKWTLCIYSNFHTRGVVINH